MELCISSTLKVFPIVPGLSSEFEVVSYEGIDSSRSLCSSCIFASVCGNLGSRRGFFGSSGRDLLWGVQ